MVLPELSEIKIKRKRLGITQSELAAKAGVSQSLVAKIESASIVPSYENAKRIFDFFDSLSEQSQARAADFMSKKVIGISPVDSVKAAVRTMKRNAVSQLPVIDKNKLVGLVSESTILNALLDSKASHVVDIMQEAPPIVSKATSINVVSNLLKHYPLVVVSEGGKLVGLITKSDLLGKLYKG